MFLLLHKVHLRTLLRSIRVVWMLSVMAGISFYLGQRLMPFNLKVDFSSYLILILSITSKNFPFKLPKWESDPFTFSTSCLQSTLTSIFSTFTAVAVFPLILIANRFCQHTGILDDYEDACTDWKMLTPALWHFFFLQDIGMKIQHYKMVLLGLAHGLLSKGPDQKCCVETSLVGPDLLSVLGFKTESMGSLSLIVP